MNTCESSYRRVPICTSPDLASLKPCHSLARLSLVGSGTQARPRRARLNLANLVRPRPRPTLANSSLTSRRRGREIQRGSSLANRRHPHIYHCPLTTPQLEQLCRRYYQGMRYVPMVVNKGLKGSSNRYGGV